MVSKDIIIKNIPNVLKSVNISGLGKKYSGKVRDYYILNGKRVIVTTDRQSAFDIIIGFIPFKGAVLNLLAAFWFEKTKDIVSNHLISVPDPNVSLVKNCQLIPIEMVIRGYITGVTNTSIWGSYEKGERVIYGIEFPEGLRKNQKLPVPVITPTTKAEKGHDERLTEKEIRQRRIVSPALWKQMKKVSLELFERGSKICAKAGIILVDTKYEFGLLKGKLVLIDEIHTPDSSRFWVKKRYIERFQKGLEPENFDKEFIRLWYIERINPYKDKILPMPTELVAAASQRYIAIYEKITGKKFVPDRHKNVTSRIKKNLSASGII